ncbi:creatininase family protein [Halocatena halophila]|uniref:creatininase family protein n=1 Tax=Halocatena halophila TaxID=2814576 RepID=UPI002ED255AD
MQLSESTWTDVEEGAPDLAVLPVGSTEQHGPHAPLGTDSLIAEAIAESAAEQYDGEIAVAPTVPVAIAEEHRHFPGTLWVSSSTFRAYVSETIESLFYHGCSRVVVVNGHGGNVNALRECCARLTRDNPAYVAPFTWFEAVSGRMGHGGTLETALISQIAPETIKTEKLETAAEEGVEYWGEYQSGTNLAYDSIEFTANGVVGDPTQADETLGEQLLTEATEALLELLATVDRRGLKAPDVP